MQYHPIANLFPLIDGAEFNALVDDIARNGLLQPIWLHPDGRIIDGRNRHRACLKAGVEPRFKTWNGKGSLLGFTVSMNVERRHLTISQRACLAVTILPRLAAEARQRLATSTGGAKPRPRQSFAQAERGRASAKAASFARVNRQYVVDAAKLQKESPDLFAEVWAGKMSLQESKRRIAARQKEQLIERIRREPMPLPEGRFATIVVDAPWEYDSSRTAYPTMPLDEILALPIANLAAEDCVLFIWATNGFLRQAFDCLDAWGFEQRTILTWVKESPGTGSYLRGQTEHCILATRGCPVFNLTGQSTALFANRREHSRKPEEFFALVESLCPASSRLEMFSRQRRRGWQAWGAEVEKFAAAS